MGDLVSALTRALTPWFPGLIYAYAATTLVLFGLWVARRPIRRVYRRWSRDTTLRLARQYRVKLNRYQLTRRLLVKQRLMEDPIIQAAAQSAATTRGVSVAETLDEVDAYLDEIVPAFSPVSYYRWGHWAARLCLKLLYRVQVSNIPEGSRSSHSARLVYVMNHRSNADYVLVAFALLERVSISYAVGEWARVWPLEFIFKSFGSYFVRRNYRNPLYHAVLKRYVQQMAHEAVAQGIFLEGGLTRSGALRKPKLGLLDYLTGVLRDPEFEGDIVFMPVGINYDRVLEDRALLRETGETSTRRSVARRFIETLRFALRGAWSSAKGRREHYGIAAVHFGEPLSLRAFDAAVDGLHENSFQGRRGTLEKLAAILMDRIGRAVPVTPVSLASLALIANNGLAIDSIPRLSQRLRDSLESKGAVLVSAGHDTDPLAQGLSTLEKRRVAHRLDGKWFLVESERPLIEYYRNAIQQFEI